MKYLTLAMLFVIGFPSLSYSYDIPAPGTKPQPPAKVADRSATPTENKIRQADTLEGAAENQKGLKRLVISIDRYTTTEARLVIPASLIRSLQGDIDKSGSFSPSNWIDGQSSLPPAGTVVGGVLMALSFLLGGLWLIRSRKLSAPNFAAIFIILSLSGIGTASLVYGNAGPPPEARSLNSKILRYGSASGELRIETTKDREFIELILPVSK